MKEHEEKSLSRRHFLLAGALAGGGLMCQPYDKSEPIKIQQGHRYRLAFVNKSDDMHPLHLHRHNFEITKIHGKATAGIFKDTVLIKGFSRVEVDFIADNPGLTLFHCHQNLHMDFGFMRLLECV